MTHRRFLFLLVPLCLLGLGGCGGGKKTVEVRGKVVLPPDVQLAEGGILKVVFSNEDPSKPGASGNCSKDLTFTLSSPDKKGVVPGKFKVTLQMTPPMGSPDFKAQADAVKSFNRRYGMTDSKLTCEVINAPTQSIVIDLTNNTVRKE
jgi:hypothetical protein